MSKFNVENIKIEGDLSFPAGPTAGNVLAIDSEGKGVFQKPAIADTDSPDAVSNVWAGTQAEYDALGSYNSDTLYFVGDEPTISANRIIRLNPDGSRDTDFDYGTGFIGDIPSVVYAIKIDNDGKIYVGGAFTSYNGVAANSIIRLNPDGSIDTDFNYGTGFSISVWVITIDDDGKIYVGGSFTSYNGVSANRIIRLNPDGTRDTDFDMGSGFNSTVHAITIDDDGKIYVGGNFISYNGVDANRIIRLNPDGSIDTDFDYGTGFASPSTVFVITIEDSLSLNRIYVGGSFDSYNGVGANRIIRLNPDGTVSGNFPSGTGFSSAGAVGAVNDIKILSGFPLGDFKIYVGGSFTSYNGVGANSIIRLNLTGTIDTDFDYGTGFDGRVRKIELENVGFSQSKIYVGGLFSNYNDISANRIIKLNSDGSIDTDFDYGTGFSREGLTSQVYDIAIDDDGKIYVGGIFTEYKKV